MVNDPDFGMIIRRGSTPAALALNNWHVPVVKKDFSEHAVTRPNIAGAEADKKFWNFFVRFTQWISTRLYRHSQLTRILLGKVDGLGQHAVDHWGRVENHWWMRSSGMVHGYHVVWGTYGFWLPNDPRGSCSQAVRAWEIACFGAARHSTERRRIDVETYTRWFSDVCSVLQNPAVKLSERQIKEVGCGFQQMVVKSELTVWACAIMPDHVHLVIGRHRYRVEQAVNLLKGAATRQLLDSGLHPFAEQRNQRKRMPAIWSRGHWKVFLDSEVAIENAIRYVEANPAREGQPSQQWEFVTPFPGLSSGGWLTYH